MRLRAAQSPRAQRMAVGGSWPGAGRGPRLALIRTAACTAVCAAVLSATGVSRAAERTTDARGGVVRVLDRITGAVSDLDLSRGEAKSLGRLVVLMDQCRYPSDDPASDAFAHLTVTDELENAVVFSGWMVASSPALSALDHPRYDVWVLYCDTPEPRPRVQETPDTGEDVPATEDGAAE